MHEPILQLPPLSLYIHIPWCARKCPYCDFNSHAVDDSMPEQSYVDALIRDLENDLPYAQKRPLQSIFFGGGTPSLFSPQAIGRILQAARRRLEFADNIEITLEANPGTSEQEKFQGYREVGVNRLSIGVQSFNDAQLQRLGRIHSGTEAIRAVELARTAGYDNINLDLMHGLPNQTREEALNDLKLAIELAPEHLSWYQLTIEPNTVFYRQPPSLPADDVLAAIQEAGQQLLTDSGYRQYEVSAYATHSRQSRHNLNYWQFGDYIGIGAGAHGKLTLPDQQQIIRTRKTRYPLDYLARETGYIAGQASIPSEDLALEFMMNALRLTDGVPFDLLADRAGLDFASIVQIWEKLYQDELVETPQQRLKTTPRGFLFLNQVLEKFS